MSKTTKISGKPRIVFFGNERIATGVSTTAPTLQALIDEGYDIAAVVSNYEKGLSRNARQLEIQSVAEKHNIPLLLPKKPSEITEQLASFGAEVAVLVAYGKIISQSVIDIFPRGIVNIHPSLLPLHRGPTPIESVILNGEAKTGVSIMSLVKAMDAGPVYGQSEITLNGNETKQELADTLLDIGKEMVIELLPGILDGSVVAIEQDESRATYDSLISKDSGVIDWTKDAATLEREVRAFAGWPKSRTQIAGKDIAITQASVHKHELDSGKIVVENNHLLAGCSKDTLVIERLIPAGKKEMTGEAFIAGHKNLLSE